MSKGTTTAVPSLRIRWASVRVPSFTDPAKSYEVMLDPTDGEPVSCECKDHTYRRRRCRHMTEAAAGRCSKPHIRAMAIPPENIQVHHREAFGRYVAKAAATTASVADLYGS